jgi:hypothetical protein
MAKEEYEKPCDDDQWEDYDSEGNVIYRRKDYRDIPSLVSFSAYEDVRPFEKDAGFGPQGFMQNQR